MSRTKVANCGPMTNVADLVVGIQGLVMNMPENVTPSEIYLDSEYHASTGFNLALIEETLSDGSKVYSVELNDTA